MKKLFLLVFIFLFIGKLQAQTCLKGQIKDRETEEPLEFANIQIYLNDEKVALFYSDSSGSFKFCNLKAENYTIVLEYAGKKTTFKNIQVFENITTVQNLFFNFQNYPTVTNLETGCILNPMESSMDFLFHAKYSKEFLRNQR